jgi:tetratricopeptide (TPR) repeat protein/cold shock CspA family protein
MSRPGPVDRDHLVSAAQAAAEKKEWDHAADLLAEAGENIEILDKRCFYLSRAKRYAEALGLLRRWLDRRPDDFMPLYMTGYQYYDQGQYAEALIWFDRAAAKYPNHLKLQWRRAFALQQVGRKDDALASAARILRLYFALSDGERLAQKSTFAKASHMLGKAELERGGSYAVELLSQAVDASPVEPYYRYLLAKALRLDGKPSAALAEIQRARRMKPGDVYIELELAAALVETQDQEGAAAALARVESRCRGWIAFKAGRIAISAGRPELAVRLLERANRDRETRGEPKVIQELKAARETARNVAPRVPEGPKRVSNGDSREGIGRVDVVWVDRGFGFLVDDTGTRRHFRLPGSATLQKGDRVRFRAVEAEKGPAAKDVVPVKR